ncbi:LysR family transcriptional regulator [Sulfitobacter sp. SK012]|uniref:helix-turn-helix domain-containing protein n=1 Tax=Sulfitobacter sp. SK012 TaxID=1389005 RepID=UPI000E0B1076|nr:LysR family transcriptional regulator [Sulfitobacter sp. SK012]AXI45073.1 LysR family transcriptional regulator [Sulfitobacter sp. SK012]
MNEPVNIPESTTEAVEVHAPPLLYEMIRSFTTLARTLNLSHAVTELNSTRQTVRRHIAQLEEMMGEPLFSIDDRRYHLTEAGNQTLPEAQDILARCNVWMRGQVVHQNGMPQYKIEFPTGGDFYQQQKPLNSIWKSDRPLLAAALKAWTMANGDLESPYFEALRPYVMVFRNSPNGWVCVELGDESSYVSWFGLATARSSIGRVLGELPGGADFARLLSQPFHDVERDRSVRVDHIYTQIPRGPDQDPVQICYARLLLGCSFPDGSFALVSVVDRHNEIEISDTPGRQMPADLVMNVDTISLNQKH